MTVCIHLKGVQGDPLVVSAFILSHVLRIRIFPPQIPLLGNFSIIRSTSTWRCYEIESGFQHFCNYSTVLLTTEVRPPRFLFQMVPRHKGIPSNPSFEWRSCERIPGIAISWSGRIFWEWYGHLCSCWRSANPPPLDNSKWICCLHQDQWSRPPRWILGCQCICQESGSN